jgi:hypothetical protein
MQEESTMNARITLALIATALVLSVGVAVGASGGSDPSGDGSTPTLPETTVTDSVSSSPSAAIPDDTPSTTATPGEPVTAVADAAGTVTYALSGSTLSVIETLANDGWNVEIEVAQGREIEVKFLSADQRVDFEAEFEDGQVEVKIRTRALEDDGTTSTTIASGESEDRNLENDGVTSTTIAEGEDEGDDEDELDEDESDNDEDEGEGEGEDEGEDDESDDS